MTEGDGESVEGKPVAGRRQLLIDVDVAAAARRSLAPTAWVVFEALAARADFESPRAEVRCSARALAEDLGLSKDTTARALRSLARQGLVRRLDQRVAANGRFAATTYQVELATAGVTVASEFRSSSVSDRTAITTPTESGTCRDREQSSVSAPPDPVAPFVAADVDAPQLLH